MPIYRYDCTACGAQNQVIAKMSDPPPVACSACGSASLVKAVSRTSFKLAGGGWYADGYGAGGGGAPAASPPSSPAPSGGSAPGASPTPSAAPASPASND